MAKLNGQQIKKDIEKAQQAFEEACITASFYLHVNGMKMDAVRDVLDISLSRSCDFVEDIRKSGKDTELWNDIYGKEDDLK